MAQEVTSPHIQRLAISLPECNSNEPGERAAQAVWRYRAVKALHLSGCATENELLQTRLFKNYCLAKAAAIGPYAHPINEPLAEQIESITSEITTVKGEVVFIKRGMNVMNGETASMKKVMNTMSIGMKTIIEQMASICDEVNALTTQTRQTN
jgi:hypothetical protein